MKHLYFLSVPLFERTRPRLLIGLFPFSFLLFTFIFLSSSFPQFSSVRIQVIDVGQADGILIRTPNRQWIVIDAGTNKNMSVAMKDTWVVDTVSLAIVSHRHFDHLGGMDEILTAFPIKLFLGNMDDCPGNTSDNKVRNIIENKEIPVHNLTQSSITIDGVVFTILPVPPASDCPDYENKNSIVIRLDYGDFSMLFPGDAETGELEWLVANNPELLDVDILKASHHGSNNGTSEDWLNAVTPDRVVISAGVNATYKHPHREAVDDYNEVTNGRIYCTNRQGTIRIYGYSDGDVRISTQRTSTESCVYTGN